MWHQILQSERANRTAWQVPREIFNRREGGLQSVRFAAVGKMTYGRSYTKPFVFRTIRQVECTISHEQDVYLGKTFRDALPLSSYRSPVQYMVRCYFSDKKIDAKVAHTFHG